MGTVDLSFTPDQAWPEEATWDGTDLGELTVTLTGALLEPVGLGEGTFVVPDLVVAGRVSRLDLPA